MSILGVHSLSARRGRLAKRLRRAYRRLAACLRGRDDLAESIGVDVAMVERYLEENEELLEATFGADRD